MLLLVAGVTGCRQSSPSAVDVPGPQPLVVGDGRTVTLISLGGAGTDPVLSRVGDDIGDAVAGVEAFWGTDWTHDIVVVATASSAQFAAEAGGADQRRDTAAVAVADRVDPAAGTARGQRIVLAPGADRMSAESLRIVLTHELFHYAARTRTALDAPRWLTEGVADFVARPAPATPMRVDTAALPADVDFAGDATQLSAAYDRAWMFARFVADRYGAAALRELYVRVCGPGHVGIDAALPEVLGAGPNAVLGEWRRWAAA